jgi:hypothetical protein
MLTIKDPRFITDLHRHFCRRRVSGAESRRAILSFRIEVSDMGVEGLKIAICDSEGPMMSLVWWQRRARPVRCLTVNHALMDCDRDELTSFVRRFLKRHGISDAPYRQAKGA